MSTCDAVRARTAPAPLTALTARVACRFRYGAERNLLPHPSFSWRQTSTESGEEVSACS